MNALTPELQQIIYARLDRFKHYRPQMEKALRLAGNQSSFDDIVEAMLKAELLWFEGNNAFAVVQIVDHPRRRDVHILLAGGCQGGINALESIVSEFGRTINATRMTLLCRKGFWRRLKNNGWKMPQFYLEKEIV
jgi:hypothetical protein